MTTKHSTPDGKPLPFGRRCQGECPRCTELANGAEPVRLAGFDARRRRETQDAADRLREHANVAAGLCICGKPRDPINHRVCTYGEW